MIRYLRAIMLPVSTDQRIIIDNKKMKINVYLRSGDLVTINHEGSYLSVQMLTQSVPAMHDTLPNPSTSYFLLSTQKLLEKSIEEEKPLQTYRHHEICYGESVILVHLLSGKFLSYSKDIQTKSTLELIGTFRDCCKFTIRPIFRCQTVVTRRIRNEEYVIFSPSQLYNREGSISLCVQKSDGVRAKRAHVLMKKNQYSRFMISRKNNPSLPQNDITNMHVLQLLNIETRKNLYMSVSQLKHRDVVSFQKNINEHGSFFDLKPVDSMDEGYIGSVEQSIEYETRFYIHSWKENKYLSINMIGDICLMQSPSEDAEFYIEQYNDEKLQMESAVRIRHSLTKKYLSFIANTSEIQMIKECRLIDTFQLIRVPIDELRLNVFVNDAHNIILRELNEGMLNYRNKRNIQKVLKELINFIYGEETTLAEFLSMKTEIVCRLSTMDQRLLAEVGIIHTLVKLGRIFIEEATREIENTDIEQKDHSEQLNIIAYIMMSIVGICSRNPSNTKIFIQEMPLLYECISSVAGIIECVYHLFKNSKQLLLILENTFHRIEKKEYLCIELLLEQISQQNFDFPMRAKIMKLLECLICLTNGEKILLHEAYLLAYFQKQKLNNVLLSLKPSDHHDLLVYLPQKQKFQELDAMLELKRSYEKELMLIREQLELMCSLCVNSNSEAFEIISEIISEEMILRYLKINLHPEFKEIFMKLLLDVYLSNLSKQTHSISNSFILTNRDPNFAKQFSKVEETTLRARLMSNEGEEMVQVNERLSHSKTIEKIQNLILEGTKKAILNEIIDSSFYMNIKALRRFFSLRILDHNEVSQFRDLLVHFISKYSQKSFKEEEKKKIILEILNIIEDYFRNQIEILTGNFVHILKTENIASEKLFERFSGFISEYPFFEIEQLSHDMSFVVDLIHQSISHQDKEIFIVSTNLMKMLNQRYRIFARELKDKIILDSDWSLDFFNRINRTKKSLKKQIHEFMTNQNDKKKLESIQQQVNQLLGQINYFFYENADGSSKFSSLTQNVYREMNLLEVIVGFLNDSQKKFKESKKGSSKIDIYAACFEFISMYLMNNEANFYRFRDKYLDIKFVFEHADRGQVKFLNHLIKISKARDLMLAEITDCLFLSFEHNPEPNPFTLLGLINVICYPDISKERVDQMVEDLTRNSDLFLWIFKVIEKRNSCYFMWSFNSDKPNYHKDWLLYLVLLVNFILIILEHCSERTAISLEVKKYINLNQILELLQVSDLIDNTSLQNLEGTLLKKQVMKLFNKLYISELNQSQDQKQKLLSLVQNNFQNLSYLREDVMGANTLLMEGVLAKGSDHESIIYEIEIGNKSETEKKDFEFNFNPVYMSLVIYFPFLIKTLDAVNSPSMTGDNSLLRKEVSILIDNIYRKFKDFVHTKLSYGEYSRKSKDYVAAISSCEEILKRKIGFNLQIEEDEDQEEEEEERGKSESKEVFMNRKLENTINCYQFASNEVERKVYRHFIYIFHSEKFNNFFSEQEKKFPIQLSFEEVIKLTETMGRFLSHRKGSNQLVLQFYNFIIDFNANHARNISFSNVREIMMSILEEKRDDMTNKKLLAYMNITKKIFRAEINKTRADKKVKESSGLFKEGFFNRISDFLLHEQVLYSGNKISEQGMKYSERKLLSFQSEEEEISIEFCLDWILSMAVLTPESHLHRYQKLFMEVVDLLKVYHYFIRDFNSRYISYEIHHKINLCLEIIFHFIGGRSHKNPFINYLIERQIWNDLNIFLSLDDGWTRNMEEFSDGQEQLFSKALRSQLRSSSRKYLREAHKIYKESKRLYKNLVPESYFPLLPMKSLFGEMKSNVIAIFKQFKHYPVEIRHQLFNRLDMATINQNIYEVYNKHYCLFTKYDIPSVEVDIDYRKKDEWRDVAENMALENGVDLTSVKMEIEEMGGNPELRIEFNNLKLDGLSSKKIQSAFSSFLALIRDFFLLFIACFLAICRKSKKDEKENMNLDEKKMRQILNFFLTKLGRVEVVGTEQSQLLVVDFMIRPECAPNREINKKFIENINFVSMQLKLESIHWQGEKFLLYYENEIDFYRRFNRINLMTFLTKNFDMITYVNFAIIVAQNVVLIANSNSDESYFIDTTLDQPFVWLQIISTAIAGLIMVAYCIKDVPLLFQNVNFKLKIRAESYGSNYNNYNIVVKAGIKGSMILLDPTFAYHLIYSIIVGLVFYNKLFAALLLLDIFFQIPNLKNLLMSIWRPKIQLILAIVSFVLVQYFFSIFMFFNFKKQTMGECETLGKCFGFVFVTTYKTVGGFVGYLFLRSKFKIPSVDFFQVYQDIYVVLVYQIFFALILAIIIDTFSLIRTEQTVRNDYLNSCCIVCNLDKSRFNSAKVNFRGHIAITHNIWNYFYYQQYIKYKPVLKRSSYERTIFLSPNANWLPANVSKDVDEDEIKIKPVV